MAHINNTRNVRYSRTEDLGNILHSDNANRSFATFCGSSEQRNMVGMQGIRRCCGQIGIVVLQNDPSFAASVSRIGEEMQRASNFRAYSVNPAGNGFYYDPLYGLDRNGAINAILCANSGSHGMMAEDELRSSLGAYLDIMRINFDRNSAPFGSSPYCLDLLLELTQMSLSDLKTRIINYLPSEAGNRIYRKLSQGSAQRRAADAVETFASELRGRLWQPRQFPNNPKMSIIEAVRRNCLINLRVDTQRPALLRYIYEELRYLIEQGTKFLLVTCNVSVAGCEELSNLFLNNHDHSYYSTGVIANNIELVSDRENALGMLLASHQDVLVFGCSNAMQAQPFSDAFGVYHRIVRETHVDSRLEPFRLFSSHGRGTNEREVMEHNINIQELLSLGTGGVLCGSLNNPPVVIRNIEMSRR